MTSEIKEKHGFEDKEFMDFIKKNRKNVIDLLNDFNYTILCYVFNSREDITTPEQIFDTDKIQKMIDHLHDSLGYYIQRYVDLDLGCKYTPRNLNEDKNENIKLS